MAKRTNNPDTGDMGILENAPAPETDQFIGTAYDEGLTALEIIRQKYGVEAPKGISDIYLYRFPNPNNLIVKNQVAKFEDLPDWGTIQNVYGGGSYLLWINLLIDGRRKTEKIYQVIEGDPIFPGQKPAPPDEKPDVLKQIADFKRLSSEFTPPPQNNNSDTSLIIEMIKQQNQVITELIKNNSKQPSEDKFKESLLTELLKAALQKSSGDFEKIQEVIGIMEMLKSEGSEKSEMWAMIKDLIKEGKELLPAVLLAKDKFAKPGPVYVPPVPGAQKPLLNPSQPPPPGNMAPVQKNGAPGPSNETNLILQAIADMKNEHKALIERIEALEGENDEVAPYDLQNMTMLDMADEAIKIIADILSSVHDEGAQENPENIEQIFNTKTETNEMDLFQQLGQLAQKAPEQDRLIVLAAFLNQYPEFIVKRFCIKYLLVKDENEYNELIAKLEPAKVQG